MKVRTGVAVLIEIAAWGLAVWILTADPGEPLAPRVWLHTSEVCRAVARKFGTWSLLAERNYWKAVRT